MTGTEREREREEKNKGYPNKCCTTKRGEVRRHPRVPRGIGTEDKKEGNAPCDSISKSRPARQQSSSLTSSRPNPFPHPICILRFSNRATARHERVRVADLVFNAPMRPFVVHDPAATIRLSAASFLKSAPNGADDASVFGVQLRGQVHACAIAAAVDHDANVACVDVAQRHDDRRAVVSPHRAVAVVARVVDSQLEFVDSVTWRGTE